jgi:hypothetical protein
MISLARPSLRRLRALLPARRPGTPGPVGTHSAMRRVDLYVIVLLVLGVTVWYAHSRRYVVTHYQVEQSLAYQRTDTWTGRTELWVVGRTAKPQWIGFTDAMPRPSQRKSPAPTSVMRPAAPTGGQAKGSSQH